MMTRTGVSSDMENAVIRVAIVEDDSEIRNLLTMIIDSSPGYSCRQSYSDCETAIPDLEKDPPDVVLMDIELPGMSGIEGVRRMKNTLPRTDFTMLTIQENDQSVFDSICAGATGYLIKDTPPAVLLDAIREVYDGGSPMTASIARRVVNSFRRPSETPLTPRETEILQRLSDGDDYKTIAGLLSISGETVRAHIKNIYKKLQVHSRGEAVKKAIQDRLI